MSGQAATGINRVAIAGQLIARAPVRISPAGIPVNRLRIDHRSTQHEAGNDRDVRCRVDVVAAGSALADALTGVDVGDWLGVRGFLSWADYRQGRDRLVVHAERIERIEFNE